MGPLLSWFPAKVAGEGGILILISPDQNMWGRDKTSKYSLHSILFQYLTYGFYSKEAFLFVVQNSDVKSIENIDFIGAEIFKCEKNIYFESKMLWVFLAINTSFTHQETETETEYIAILLLLNVYITQS